MKKRMGILVRFFRNLSSDKGRVHKRDGLLGCASLGVLVLSVLPSLLIFVFIQTRLLKKERVVHTYINKLFVDVVFDVVYDIGVIHQIKDGDLLLDHLGVVVSDSCANGLDGDLDRGVVQVVGLEDSAECSLANHLGLLVDEVILPQLTETLVVAAIQRNFMSLSSDFRLQFCGF